MKKVFQTIHEYGKGNYMQAGIASLFDLELEEVPNFIDIPDWHRSLIEFVKSRGYTYHKELYNKESARLRGNHFKAYKEWYEDYKSEPNQLEELKNYEGINGLFFASVFSPKYLDLTRENPGLHAVIIDKNFNIIHDPEPSYQNIKEYPMKLELGYNGIIDVDIIEINKDE